MPAQGITRAEAAAAEASFEDRMAEHRHLIHENVTRTVDPAGHRGAITVHLTVNVDPYVLALCRSTALVYRGRGGKHARLVKKRARMKIRTIERRQHVKAQASYRKASR